MTEDRSKNIFRTDKTKNYSVIDNRPLSDKRLSWKARGILSFILTRPDDWVFYIDELIGWSEPDGEASFRAGWKELKDLGYISRVPVREGQRIVRWDTIVHEIPSLLPDFLDVENLHVGFLDVENRALLNTDLKQSTDLKQNTKLYLNLEELKHVKITKEEYEKLNEITGSEEVTKDYLYQFGAWILTQTPRKQKSASPYLSIRNWYKRDKNKGAVTPKAAAKKEQPAGTKLGFLDGMREEQT